ncbi:hypothetical protein YC2023_020127 [Brassica napus]
MKDHNTLATIILQPQRSCLSFVRGTKVINLDMFRFSVFFDMISRIDDEIYILVMEKWEPVRKLKYIIRLEQILQSGGTQPGKSWVRVPLADVALEGFRARYGHFQLRWPLVGFTWGDHQPSWMPSAGSGGPLVVQIHPDGF